MGKAKWLLLVAVVCVVAVGCSSNSFVKTQPSEADIYLNGNYVGVSPCAISGGSLGSITITAKKKGYKDTSKTITANQVSGKTAAVGALGCLACGPCGAGAAGASAMELPPEIEITLEKEEK